MDKKKKKILSLFIVLVLFCVGFHVIKSTMFGNRVLSNVIQTSNLKQELLLSINEITILNNEQKELYANHYSNVYNILTNGDDNLFIKDWCVSSIDFMCKNIPNSSESLKSLEERLNDIETKVKYAYDAIGETPTLEMKNRMMQLKENIYQISEKEIFNTIKTFKKVKIKKRFMMNCIKTKVMRNLLERILLRVSKTIFLIQIRILMRLS